MFAAYVCVNYWNLGLSKSSLVEAQMECFNFTQGIIGKTIIHC